MRPVRVLQHACEHGWLEKAQWVLARFRISSRRLHGGADAPFWRAWRNGHTEVARWLIARSPVPLRALLSQRAARLLRACCSKGHLGLIQLLIATCDPVTSHVDHGIWFRVHLTDSLAVACARGHLEVVRWIMAHCTFGAGCSLYDALHGACRHGHLAVVAHLVAAAPEPPKRVSYARLIRSACAAGHHDIARLVHEKFHKMHSRSYNLLEYEMSWMWEACRFGNFTTADWIMSTFDVSLVDPDQLATALKGMLLKLAGNLPAVRWLVRHFEISPDNPRYKWLDSRLWAAEATPQCEWLRRQFKYAALP
jgi:hypothetical protein